MIRQGIQTNFKHADLKVWGCYWFTLAAWSQVVSNREWTDDQLIAKYEEHLAKNWINRTEKSADGKIYPWVRYATEIFNDMAGSPAYFVNVAHTINDKDYPKTRRFPAFYERTSPNGYDHFTLCELDKDGKLRTVFDSWANPAESRGMKVKNYRRFS